MSLLLFLIVVFALLEWLSGLSGLAFRDWKDPGYGRRAPRDLWD